MAATKKGKVDSSVISVSMLNTTYAPIQKVVTKTARRDLSVLVARNVDLCKRKSNRRKRVFPEREFPEKRKLPRRPRNPRDADVEDAREARVKNSSTGLANSVLLEVTNGRLGFLLETVTGKTDPVIPRVHRAELKNITEFLLGKIS